MGAGDESAPTKSCTAAVLAVSARLQVFGNREAGITLGLGHPLCADLGRIGNQVERGA